MARFWCDKHECVVDESGCMECIQEWAGEEDEDDDDSTEPLKA